MTPDDLTADLPAPRDDEPPSLRADIVDELADHLQCAVRREELRSNQETSTTEPRGLSPWPNQRSNEETNPRRSPVYQRVLARFGDPAAVARKLWWDAMWEKVMGQRLMAATTGLVAVCAIGVLIVSVMLLDQMSALLTDAQAVNAALIDRLDRQQELAVENYDWCDFRIKLAQDRPDGPPMTAAKVVLFKLQGGATDNSRSFPSKPQQPGSDGRVDFSPVPYGYYYLMIRTASGDLFKEEIAVHPGKDYERTIVCPVSPPTGKVVPAAISTAVSVPDELRDRVWVLCRVYQPWVYTIGLRAGEAVEIEYGGTRLAGDRWILSNVQTVLIDPNGGSYPVDWPVAPPSGVGTTGVTPAGNGGGLSPMVQQLEQSFSVAALSQPMQELTLPAGEYTLDWEVVLMSETPDTGQAATWTLLDDETRSQLAVEQKNTPKPAPTIAIAAETTHWPLQTSSYDPMDGKLFPPSRVAEFPDQITSTSLGVMFQQTSGFGGGGFGGGGFF